MAPGPGPDLIDFHFPGVARQSLHLRLLLALNV